MCIQAPTISGPALGGGLSLEPPTVPGFSGELGLCCKTVPYSTPTPPLPFPSGVFNPGVAAALATAITFVNTFLDGIVPDCPLE